nr:MAG TPA: hypothetical protein [Caudoviricetes sp.]
MSETNAPYCGRRLTLVGWTGGHRRPRVKAIGSKTVARQGEARRPATQPRPSQRKRRHHKHEACGTEARQRCDPPPFEAEQRNHSRSHHLPDRIVLRGGWDAWFRGGYLGPVGGAGSTVTPAIPNSTNTRGRGGDTKCFTTRISPLTSRIGRGVFGWTAQRR